MEMLRAYVESTVPSFYHEVRTDPEAVAHWESQMNQSQNYSDPTIDEIREIRHRISERFGHDPAKLVAYYMELQEQHRDRLIKPRGTVQKKKPLAE